MKKGPFAPFRSMSSLAVDRFGKRIEPGHIVLWKPPVDMMYEVVEIKPALDASLPQNQAFVHVVMKADMKHLIEAAKPNLSLIVVGETEARIKAKAESNGTPVEATPEPSGIVLTDPQPDTGESVTGPTGEEQDD